MTYDVLFSNLLFWPGMRTRFILVQGPLWIDARPYKYMYAVVAVVIDQ